MKLLKYTIFHTAFLLISLFLINKTMNGNWIHPTPVTEYYAFAILLPLVIPVGIFFSSGKSADLIRDLRIASGAFYLAAVPAFIIAELFFVKQSEGAGGYEFFIYVIDFTGYSAVPLVLTLVLIYILEHRKKQAVEKGESTAMLAIHDALTKPRHIRSRWADAVALYIRTHKRALVVCIILIIAVLFSIHTHTINQSDRMNTSDNLGISMGCGDCYAHLSPTAVQKPTAELDLREQCVKKAQEYVIEHSRNTSSGRYNTGDFYSFDMHDLTRLQCASRGDYFQYEAEWTTPEGKSYYQYELFDQDGNGTRRETCSEKGGTSFITHEDPVTNTTTSLEDGTCAYRDGIPRNATSIVRYSR